MINNLEYFYEHQFNNENVCLLLGHLKNNKPQDVIFGTQDKPLAKINLSKKRNILQIHHSEVYLCGEPTSDSRNDQEHYNILKALNESLHNIHS